MCPRSQVRESGDPYFLQTPAVAGIIVDMRLDSAIATALLHDTVEDTLATIVQIEENFGKEVAQLVDGVTKLSQLKLDPVNEKNKEAENLESYFSNVK